MNELISLALSRSGAETLSAFQEQHGLPVTGEADSETLLAMEPYLLGYQVVRVAPGDSYWLLARRYGTTPQAIAIANPSLDPERLPVGTALRVPLPFPVVPRDVPMTARLCSLCIRGILGRYPFCRMESLTTTAFGRAVESLSLGAGNRKVLYTAAHHANEWITATVLLAFAEDLAKAAAEGGTVDGVPARDLLAAATFHLVPMVDPDGVDLVTGALGPGTDGYEYARALAAYYPAIPFPDGWKANLLGTDLNLNYPAGWETAREIKFSQGYTRPGPRDYVGAQPLDQRETIALARYTRVVDPALVLAFHSQGEVIYWQFQDIYVPGARELGERFAQASGYALEDTPYNSAFAGYKDWFIQEYRRPGFTIEVGHGVNPLPLSQFMEIYEAVLPILVIAASPEAE